MLTLLCQIQVFLTVRQIGIFYSSLLKENASPIIPDNIPNQGQIYGIASPKIGTQGLIIENNIKIIPNNIKLIPCNCFFIKTSIISHLSIRHIEIYLSVINTALHGEPSAPDKFNGTAFKK